MILLIDIGNTCLKWATYQSNTLGAVSSLKHRGEDLCVSLETAFKSLPTPQQLWLAHVIDPARIETIIAWMTARWQILPTVAHSQPQWLGLKNGYIEPARLGVDRWLGLMGVWSQKKAPFCLISAGTAITIDVVEPEGQHQGGLILPGWALALTALSTYTYGCQRLTPSVISTDVGPWARETTAALEGGRTYFYQALFERLKKDVPSGHIDYWLTGGDAEHIRPFLPFSTQYQPNLVLLGLAAWGESETG